METRKQNGKEKAVVVGGGVVVSVGDGGEIGTGYWVFAGNGCGSEFFTAGEGFCDESVITDYTDVRKEWFELAADSGEISLNGLGFDMMAHEDNEKTEGVGSGLNGKGVEGAEGNVRMEGGGVRGKGCGFKGKSKSDGTFVFQSFNRPGSANRLPGLSDCGVHCVDAPSDK